ncbi:MAG: hypothetical protein K6E30_11080 [Lachnospiraceae bacterium]|nr:hypothetical protein [Lachnospiraceae bacterium]
MTKMNTMAQASFTLGLLSLFMTLTGSAYIPGSLSIICAFLSREDKMSAPARFGTIFSAVSMTILTAVYAFLIWLLISTGLFTTFYEKAKNLDPDDPIAIAEFQQEVITTMQDVLIKDLMPGYESPAGDAVSLPADADGEEVIL